MAALAPDRGRISVPQGSGLGLEPDRLRERLVTTAPAELPQWVGNVRVTGVRAFGRPWDVILEDGAVEVVPG